MADCVYSILSHELPFRHKMFRTKSRKGTVCIDFKHDGAILIVSYARIGNESEHYSAQVHAFLHQKKIGAKCKHVKSEKMCEKNVLAKCADESDEDLEMDTNSEKKIERLLCTFE